MESYATAEKQLTTVPQKTPCDPSTYPSEDDGYDQGVNSVETDGLAVSGLGLSEPTRDVCLTGMREGSYEEPTAKRGLERRARPQGVRHNTDKLIAAPDYG